MTPIAWKKPLFTVNIGREKFPRSAAGTRNPCVTTVTTMMVMLARANALALASYHCHQYPLKAEA